MLSRVPARACRACGFLPDASIGFHPSLCFPAVVANMQSTFPAADLVADSGEQPNIPICVRKGCLSFSTGPALPLNSGSDARFANCQIKITSVEKGTVKAGLQVEKKHLNSKGFLHGTVSTCLIDWMGSMVIASHGLEKTGLSTDIHATYIATAQEGDVLLVVGQASRVGRSLAFLTVNISKVLPSGETQIVATGTHTKYIKQ